MRPCRRDLSPDRIPLPDTRGLGLHGRDHRAWIIVEVGSKDEARNIVPSGFRSQARVVRLNSFTMEQVEELRRHHGSNL